MSNEDSRRQHLRTQGKYSNQDKRQKTSPLAKDLNENKYPKRYSNENRKSNSFASNEPSPVKYEENSNIQIIQLPDDNKPTVINQRGLHRLSDTDNGVSKLYYEPNFLCKDEAWDVYEQLYDTTQWHSKNIVIRGEEFPQPRLVAWYGPYPYTYSGTTLEPAQMPDIIVQIKKRIETWIKTYGELNTEFNSVLLNLYRDEKDSVSWHSDDELTMGIHPTIASISLGEVRKFEIRPINMPEERQKVVFMNHGSLIVMDGAMQEDWQHRVPKEYHSKNARINLTFRTVFPIDESRLPVKEPNKLYAEASNSNKPTNSSKTLELDDENFPALNSHVKRSSVDAKHNGNVSETSEVWDSDRSWERDNKITRNNSNGGRTTSRRDNNSVENCIDASATDKITRMKSKNLKEDSKFHTSEDKIKLSDRDLRKDQETTNLPCNQSNERLRSERIDDSQSRWRREDVNQSSGRFSRTQNYDRRNARRFDDQRTFQNSTNDDTRKQSSVEQELRQDENHEGPKRQQRNDQNDRFAPTQASCRRPERVQRDDIERQRKNIQKRDDEDEGTSENLINDDARKKQSSEEQELRQDDNYEVPRRQLRKDQNNRFSATQANNKKMERFSRVQNDEEWQGKQLRMRDEDNRSYRNPQRRDSNRRIENDSLPPRFRNKGNPSRFVSDEAPVEDSFDNDKHASELTKEHSASAFSKEPSSNALNVEAEEFVPCFLKPINRYDGISLEDLVHYQINIMSDEVLFNYANALRCRVLENIQKFNVNEKEELEFLCAITDGTQTVKNQRLISIKTVNIVVDYLTRFRSVAQALDGKKYEAIRRCIQS